MHGTKLNYAYNESRIVPHLPLIPACYIRFADELDQMRLRLGMRRPHRPTWLMYGYIDWLVIGSQI